MSILYWRKTKQKGEIIEIPKIKTLLDSSISLENKTNLTSTGKYTRDESAYISPFHKWMRKYWIDEIPQLYSLFKGDLKLIGIRPVEPKDITEFSPTLKSKLEEEVKYGLIGINYGLDKEKDFSNSKSTEALYRFYLKNILKNH